MIPTQRIGLRLLSRFGVAVLLALVTAIYLRGLLGGFIFDDYPNIIDNRAIQLVDGSLRGWIAAAFSSDAGSLGRPVSMLSFALNYYLSGADPAPFKAVNLLIHLANGALVFSLSRLLLPLMRATPSEPVGISHTVLALLVTALWLLHPLHVSSVLYVVQRMNLLASFFTLLALISYTRARLNLLTGDSRWLLPLVAAFVFSVFSVLSKENGALVVLYALTIELACFRFAAATPRTSAILKTLIYGGMVTAAGLIVVTAVLNPTWMAENYAMRSFTLSERLLTECRVLIAYLGWTLLPNLHWMGLYHDDFSLSRNLLEPATTLLSVLALVGLSALAVYWRRRHVGFSFAVGWFLLGHSMESTVLPLELVFEHRQYLPMLGVILGLSIETANLLQKHPRLALTTGALMIAGLSALTTQRVLDWSDNLRLARVTVEDHPNSSRSLYDYARMLIIYGDAEGQVATARVAARPYFMRAAAADHRSIYPPLGLLLSYQGETSLPHELVLSLADTLRSTPLLQPVPLMAVIKAANQKKLPISVEEVDLLVDAAMENVSLSARLKGLILSTYGLYRYETAKDPQGAIGLTLSAIEFEPTNPLFQFNAASLAYNLGQFDIARKHLAAADALDGMRSYQKETRELRAKLAAPPAPMLIPAAPKPQAAQEPAAPAR